MRLSANSGELEPQAERTDEESQGTDVASTESEDGLNDTSQDDVSELDELEDELAKEFAEEEAEELMAVVVTKRLGAGLCRLGQIN